MSELISLRQNDEKASIMCQPSSIPAANMGIDRKLIHQ